MLYTLFGRRGKRDGYIPLPPILTLQKAILIPSLTTKLSNKKLESVHVFASLSSMNETSPLKTSFALNYLWRLSGTEESANETRPLIYRISVFTRRLVARLRLRFFCKAYKQCLYWPCRINVHTILNTETLNELADQRRSAVVACKMHGSYIGFISCMTCPDLVKDINVCLLLISKRYSAKAFYSDVFENCSIKNKFGNWLSFKTLETTNNKNNKN